MRPSPHRAVSLALLLGALAACAPIQQDADVKFGDQNFKSAIALIELYKVRYAAYPEHLSDIKYTGDWDQLYLSGVSYTKLSDGYELDVTRGWVGKPTLSYPPEFWHGLGIRKTNVGGFDAATGTPQHSSLARPLR